MKRGRGKRWIAAVLAVVIGAAVLYAAWVGLRPADPVYQGKRLSKHLLEADKAAVESLPRFYPTNSRAVYFSSDAVRELGTNAFPLLRHWLRQNRSGMVRRIDTELRRHGYQWMQFSDRAAIAAEALYKVPEIAAPLAPELIGLFREGEPLAQVSASMVLGRILESAPREERKVVAEQMEPVIEEMIAAAANGSFTGNGENIIAIYYRVRRPSDVEQTLRRLRALKDRRVYQSAKNALSPDGVLIAVLDLEGEGKEKVQAVRFLRDNPEDPERAVPLLIKCLKSDDTYLQHAAAVTLGVYGSHSFAAVPALTNLYMHRYPWVSNAAAQAIAKINAEAM